MIDDLTKTFFDTFGIEPKVITEPRYSLNSEYYEVTVETYPELTDHLLLELMFLITDINTSFELRNIRNVTALKTAILEFFIKKYGSSQNRKILKHQVRTLFEEG